MATTGFTRGHPILWDEDLKLWCYADDGTPATTDRPCAKCGKPPAAEGHDACLGNIPGATSACCGHGVEPGYAVIDGERCPLPQGAL